MKQQTLTEAEMIEIERERVQSEYRRREREVAEDFYAPYRPSELFMRAGRKRVAAALLQEAGVFPAPGDECLEVGCGALGWLGDLISWGVPERNLHGIELDAVRLERARSVLPLADLRLGDACGLPWGDGEFRLVVASTLFTSILSAPVRRRVAGEITRVLAPGGALLWYDFAVNNPRNSQVRRVGRRELKGLFPQLAGRVASVTLAPPLARLIAPQSWTLATVLEAVPLLRTHLLGVLVKHS